MSKRKSEYKPLLFTTTIRNPDRIKNFLKVLVPYNGKILTNNLIDSIAKDLIREKYYIPNYIRSNSVLNEILKDDDRKFNTSQLNDILVNSPQNHKEAGFDRGWPSRFDTWYKFMKELGFVYYNIDEPIIISEAGLSLSLSDQPDKRHLEQQVFLNALVKYHRVNPFKRVKNANKPLILLLKVIKELNEILGKDNPGLSMKELPLIICWKDSNHIDLVNMILSIRKTYSFTPSNEYIYNLCKEILNLEDSDENRFKSSNILDELPDEFVRKMRLTGLLSIRGMGRFLDINKKEVNKIDYVLEHYDQLKTFYSEKSYFDFMKQMDMNLISLEAVDVPSIDKKDKLFRYWVDKIEKTVLINELKILSNSRRNSKHEIFKYINGPIRLEFLTSLIIKKYFPDIAVKGNYNIDDEGLPTSFAPGGDADIVCRDEIGDILYEVTLLTGTQQNIREMPSIARHLRDYINNYSDSYSVLLAPQIHNDTLEYAEFIKTKDNLNIHPISILNFLSKIEKLDNFRNLVC